MPADSEISNLYDQFSIFIEVNVAPGLDFPTLLGNNWPQSFWLGLDTGDYKLRFWLNNHVYQSETGIPAGIWTKIAITYDGNFLKFFINGVVNKSYPVTGTINKADTPFKIGADVNDSYPFRGIVRGIRIYDTAIDPSGLLSFVQPSGDILSKAQFVDRELDDGYYHYAIRGIDLFGRVSKWCEQRPVGVKNLPVYNAPVSLKASFNVISANVLSTIANDAGEVAGIISSKKGINPVKYSQLNGCDIEFYRLATNNTGTPNTNTIKQNFEILSINIVSNKFQIDFKKATFPQLIPSANDNFLIHFDYQIALAWQWTGLQQVYNAGVTSFELYMLMDNKNELTGIISNVTEYVETVNGIEDTRFQLEVHVDNDVEVNEFSGLFLNVNNRLYEIIDHHGEYDITFRVKYNGYPLIKPVANVRTSLNIPETSNLYFDYANRENWGASIATVSNNTTAPVITGITETPQVEFLSNEEAAV